MSMKSGLGRGFDSLIPTDLIDDEFEPTSREDKRTSELRELKIDDVIRDEDQPRRDFDEEALGELAASIGEHGGLQPIVVTKEGDKYKIVAGERRWRASRQAGLTTLPAIVRSIDSQHRLELSVIENAQREDLNAIELATAYAKLKDQFNMTTAEVAAKVGKGEQSIVNTMRLLALPDFAKKTMVEEKLSEGVMRPLVACDEATIKKLLPLIVAEGWTARKVERYLALTKKASSAKAIKRHAYQKSEDALSVKYNVDARITGRSLTLKCKSEKDLKALIEKLS